MRRPLVSICVPTCNRVDFLRESLASITAQTYTPLEILVSDNASTDDTAAVCRALAARDPRVRYVGHTRNIGLYENHNFCIDESRGDYLCFFHDDDLYTPAIVERYVELMQRAPRAGLACADWELIDEHGHVIGERRFVRGAVIPGLEYIDRTIRTGRSSLNCPGVFIRREALGARRFDVAGTLGATDFLLWFGVAEGADVGHLGTVLWRNRIHRRSLSRGPVLRFVEHFHTTVSRYCNDYLGRHPGETARVTGWRAALDTFTFWATLYEVCLHFRGHRRATDRVPQTTFELVPYTLEPAQIAAAVDRLHEVRRGALQRAVLLGLRGLMASRLTAPVGWLASHAGTARRLLRLER